jgi:hypothetical protein
MAKCREEDGMRARGACDWAAATSTRSTLLALLPQLDRTLKILLRYDVGRQERWTREHGVSPEHHVIRYADGTAQSHLLPSPFSGTMARYIYLDWSRQTCR